MSGFITKAECKNNKELIISLWGVRFYTACLESEGETFLGLLVKFGFLPLDNHATA